MTMRIVDLRAEAAAEAGRLSRARLMLRDGDAQALAWLEGDATWIAMPRRSRLKRSLGRRVCLVWRTAFDDASGRLVESRLVPILVDVGGVFFEPPQHRRTWIRSLLRRAEGAVRARVEADGEGWRTEVARTAGAFTAARLARERDIARARAVSGREIQAGLFDRRADRARQDRVESIAEREQSAVDCMQTATAGGTIAIVPARLLLVLVP